MDKWQMVTVLSASLGSGVLVILSWINSNARTARLEQGQDRLQGEIEKLRLEVRSETTGLRSEIHAESSQTRTELRAEFRSELGLVRSELTSLRDLVYRDGVLA